MQDSTAIPSLSVVIPAYNEERRLPSYLNDIVTFFQRKSCSYEIIVVDDGSTDATATLVQQLGGIYPHLRIIRLPHNRGKGFAVRTGMLHATGKLRLFADADGATPVAELERLQAAIERGADIAIGSRAIKDDTCRVDARLHRRIIGAIFKACVRTVAVRGVVDTQCGFKLFTAASASALFPLQRIDDFGFDVEILYIAGKKGYTISEVPVNWTDIDGSKIDLFRDSLKMLFDLFIVRKNDLKGYYR